MKLAILGLLATGASASFSMRRLQDSSAPHPGECNIDSDCIDEDKPEGICVPKAAHSHDHLRRKLFGGVVYSGYCMDLVCMAGESTFYQAHAEGLFSGDSSPVPTIQQRGWCDDGTADGWVTYAHSSEASCSDEVKGQMSGYMALSCQCPGLDWTNNENGVPPIICSITDDMPAICEESIKALFLADTIAEQGQEAADNTWAMYTGACNCPIADFENIFCELKDLPAECEGIYRPLLVESWIASGQDAAAANAFWDSAMAMSLCECGTQGGTRYESDKAQEGDFDLLGWSGQSLCGETDECKNEVIDSWVLIASLDSTTGDGPYVAPTRAEMEATFNAMCGV
uniref:Uncharacterized protein n=1 Tax=Triparma pacifica TaxID=91992 RepID=A0A7S2VWY6_9STRA|mmetsp:Transcript_968/g.1687  ORF Transcript_968/g.1687 Transcript_968/m.1687 type:complete len:342 (+) Transcript_968:185-1210(+)